MTWPTTGTRVQLDPEVVRLVEGGTPFARLLGAHLVELGAERAVLSLEAEEQLRNHVGGPHAATLFGLAETAATGPVTATATFAGDVGGVRESIANRGVAVFPVDVVVTAADGTTTTQARCEMALKRLG